MANRYSNLVAAMGDEILDSLSTNNIHQEIESHQSSAIIHLRKREFLYAAKALGDMADLIKKEGFPTDEALVRFNQARAYAKLPDHLKYTLDACYAALSLAEKANNRRLKADVCLFMAKLEIAHENFFSAHLAIGQAINLYEGLGDQLGNLIRCYHIRGGVAAFLLMFDLSRQSFLIASELAKIGDSQEKVNEIQKHRSAVVQFEKGRISTQYLSKMLKGTIQFGRHEINGNRFLNDALNELELGNHANALKLAENSQNTGRKEQSVDGAVKYLLASIILAEIHDAKKARATVLHTLLQSKACLEKHFSSHAGGHFIKQYLDSFHVRWGKTELKHIVQKYHSKVLARQAAAK